jgi:hypothetical protein
MSARRCGYLRIYGHRCHTFAQKIPSLTICRFVPRRFACEDLLFLENDAAAAEGSHYIRLAPIDALQAILSVTRFITHFYRLRTFVSPIAVAAPRSFFIFSLRLPWSNTVRSGFRIRYSLSFGRWSVFIDPFDTRTDLDIHTPSP